MPNATQCKLYQTYLFIVRTRLVIFKFDDFAFYKVEKIVTFAQQISENL